MFTEITNNNELSHSLQRLNSNMQNKYYFRLNPFEIIKDSTIKENYYKKNRRNSYYINCSFVNCNFIEAGFASSIFVECEFLDCDFDFSNFQSCDFRKCKICSTDEMKEIKGNTFMKSVFFECIFERIKFNSTNFCNSVFNNGSILNCKFNSCGLEDMVIKNSLMDSIRFSSQNFDYLRIENIITQNTVFPFPSMPCIIDGLKYVKGTKDDVSFTSSEINQRLNKEEYLTYIPDFINYYKKIEDYFVLANIVLSLENNINGAFSFILSGIEQSIKIHDFRKVRKYCNLLINENFNIQHKKIAYQTISNEISKLNFSESDKDSYSIHLRELRNTLMNETARPYLIINISTNIQETESDKIAIFIAGIESLITLSCSGNEEHSIELRHNSDERFFVQIVSDPNSLIIFLAALFECIDYATKFGKFLIKKTKKFLENQKKKSEGKNDLLKLNNNDLTDKQISIINKMGTAGSLTIEINKTFVDNHIEIKGISHSMVNVENVENKVQNSYFDKHNVS